MGFSSNLVTGVWTGFDENKTMGFGEAGSRSALPIWIDFMNLGIKKSGESDFIAPKGIINVMIDPETGKLPYSGSAKVTEVFVEGTEPGSIETQENAKVQENSDLFEDDDYYSN
jgi:penicillin-binding protein 1A